MQLDLTPGGQLAIDVVNTCPLQTNTYLAVSAGEAVVVDPGGEGAEVYAYLAEKHPGVRLAAVISTHGHGDHVGGVEGVLDACEKACGVRPPYLISETDAERAQSARANSSHSFGYDADAPAPDRMLHEGDTVTFGEVTLQVVETPGHTPGGVELFCACAAGHVAFVGDTLFPGSAGRTDLADGDADALLASLGKLARLLPADTLCLVGHGPSTVMERELAANPYIAEARARGL